MSARQPAVPIRQLRMPAFLRRIIWPHAPIQPAKPVPITAPDLMRVFAQMAFTATVGETCAELDDALIVANLGIHFQEVLRLYRAGAGMTEHERQLGHALDHVASRYLRA